MSIVDKIAFRILRNGLSDEAYALWVMRREFGAADIRNPQTFNEKIQWLKLYDRRPMYSKAADKLAVRKYVDERIGRKYLTHLYGSYQSVRDLSGATLPTTCALKCTHGSGMNVFITEKNQLNRSKIRKLKRWMATDYYRVGREWVYQGIEPRIICEELLVGDDGKAPKDFKLFCFDGKVRFIQVDVDRFGDHRREFFEVDWRVAGFGLMYPRPNVEIARPVHLEEMISVAERLSQGIPFVRVDLYETNRVLFGEMTFYPGNGIERFSPDEYDLLLGELLPIPASV